MINRDVELRIFLIRLLLVHFGHGWFPMGSPSLITLIVDLILSDGAARNFVGVGFGPRVELPVHLVHHATRLRSVLVCSGD